MNTIRELKQQEKYKTMLKRKNKEKKIYKDKNSSLRIEKMNLIKCVERKDKEIEKLKEKIENMKMSYETDAEAKYYDFVNKHESKLQQRIDKAIEYIESCTWNNGIDDELQYSLHIPTLLKILKGDDK